MEKTAIIITNPDKHWHIVYQLLLSKGIEGFKCNLELAKGNKYFLAIGNNNQIQCSKKSNTFNEAVRTAYILYEKQHYNIISSDEFIKEELNNVRKRFNEAKAIYGILKEDASLIEPNLDESHFNNKYSLGSEQDQTDFGSTYVYNLLNKLMR
jgi:hypothetical protein